MANNETGDTNMKTTRKYWKDMSSQDLRKHFRRIRYRGLEKLLVKSKIRESASTNHS